jgi:hypothetical protein
MEPIRRFSLEDYTDPSRLVVLCKLASLEEAECALREQQLLFPAQRFRISYTTGMRKINKYYPTPFVRTNELPVSRVTT